MTSLINGRGRLCNQLIRAIAVSMAAEKHNNHVEYYYYQEISRLGIPLFVGTNTYPETILLTDDNYFQVLYSPIPIYKNFEARATYFQTREISRMIYTDFLRNPQIQTQIMNANPYKSRYGNNQDCFIHVRLGDVDFRNPGINYYLMALREIEKQSAIINRIYVSSDSPEHEIVQQILQNHENTIFYNSDDVSTIQFASTCANLILSHGSYSAVMGWLAYHSNVFYPEYMEDHKWHGDMFSIDGWNMIQDYR